jgi:hypothetical protein
MGQDRPMPPIAEYSRQLRERAREAQELADRLRREADELDQMAGRTPMPGMAPRPPLGMVPEPADPMQRELMEIKEAIGRAEQEGQHEKAADLRRRAEQLGDQMRARERGPQEEERRLVELKARIEQLQNRAREAQAAGRDEEALRLLEEIEGVEMKSQSERQIGNMAAQAEAMRDKMVALRRQAEQAKREGREEEARTQWETAGDIERQIGDTKRKIERFRTESQLKYARMTAERAEKRGDTERAEALTREARELERQLQSSGPDQGPQIRGDDLPRMVDELRLEVKRLRQEMEELKRQVHSSGPR